MQVLILEEDPVAAGEWAERLRQFGYSVIATDRLSEALLLTRTQRFDLVISSLLLGEESGLSVVMAAQYHNPDAASILLSDSLIFANGELFSMLSSLRCVLGKPVPTEDLMSIARFVLGKPSGRAECTEIAQEVPQICGHCLLSSACGRAENDSAAPRRALA